MLNSPLVNFVVLNRLDFEFLLELHAVDALEFFLRQVVAFLLRRFNVKRVCQSQFALVFSHQELKGPRENIVIFYDFEVFDNFKRFVNHVIITVFSQQIQLKLAFFFGVNVLFLTALDF